MKTTREKIEDLGYVQIHKNTKSVKFKDDEDHVLVVDLVVNAVLHYKQEGSMRTMIPIDPELLRLAEEYFDE